jgi:hypothetical protein
MGAFRIVFCLWLMLDAMDFLGALPALHSRNEALLQPCAAFRQLGLSGEPDASFAQAAPVAFWILAAASTLGAGTRFSLLALALLNLLLRGWQNSWVYVGHASIAPAFALFVLAFSPGVASWSVDALANWLWDRRLGRAGPLRTALAGPPAPVWPVHLLLAVLSVFYFASGVAKLRDGGASWATGRTLQLYLDGRFGDRRLGDSVQFFTADPSAPASARFRDPWALSQIANSASATPAGKRIAKSRSACAALAWATILMECGFWLIFVLPRRGQLALLLSFAAFHFSIEALMRINFASWTVLYLAAVDWGAAGRALDAAFPRLGLKPKA